MKLKNGSLILLYFGYSFFIKLFFVLFNNILYVEFPEELSNGSIIKEEDNLLTIFVKVIISDLFWLLPYTVMNIYILTKLIKHLEDESKYVLEQTSFAILKAYFFWCMVYLFSIGFGFNLKENGLDSLFGGPFAPYGCLTITYFLLGNFVFILIFIPLWNRLLKGWMIKTKD